MATIREGKTASFYLKDQTKRILDTFSGASLSAKIENIVARYSEILAEERARMPVDAKDVKSLAALLSYRYSANEPAYYAKGTMAGKIKNIDPETFSTYGLNKKTIIEVLTGLSYVQEITLLEMVEDAREKTDE